jgi:hypothetical protein
MSVGEEMAEGEEEGELKEGKRGYEWAERDLEEEEEEQEDWGG